jgi:hypothetical protein
VHDESSSVITCIYEGLATIMIKDYLSEPWYSCLQRMNPSATFIRTDRKLFRSTWKIQ